MLFCFALSVLQYPIDVPLQPTKTGKKEKELLSDAVKQLFNRTYGM